MSKIKKADTNMKIQSAIKGWESIGNVAYPKRFYSLYNDSIKKMSESLKLVNRIGISNYRDSIFEVSNELNRLGEITKLQSAWNDVFNGYTRNIDSIGKQFRSVFTDSNFNSVMSDYSEYLSRMSETVRKSLSQSVPEISRLALEMSNCGISDSLPCYTNLYNLESEELKALYDTTEDIVNECKEEINKEVKPASIRENAIKCLKYIIFCLIIPYLFGAVGDNILIQNNRVNINTENRYYINEEDDFLSAKKYADFRICFVMEEVIEPRNSSKNSARIVSKLTYGKLVRIIEKKKKWVKIRWKENDCFEEGWIQNYKLGYFK